MNPSNTVNTAIQLTQNCLNAVERNDRNDLLFNKDSHTFETKARIIENAASTSNLKIRGHAATFFRGIGGFQSQIGKALEDLKILTERMNSEYLTVPQEGRARLKEDWQLLQQSVTSLKSRVSAEFENNPKLTSLAEEISHTIDWRIGSFAREQATEGALDVGSSEAAISSLRDHEYRPVAAEFERTLFRYQEAQETPPKERSGILTELDIQLSRILKMATGKRDNERFEGLSRSCRELRNQIESELAVIKPQVLRAELQEAQSSIAWGQPPKEFTGGFYKHSGASTLAANLMGQTAGSAALATVSAGDRNIALPELFLSDIMRMGRVSCNREMLYCQDPTEDEQLIEPQEGYEGRYATAIQNALGLADEKLQAVVLLVNQDFQRELLENLVLATGSGFENILDYQKWHMDISVGADNQVVISSTKVFQVMPTDEDPSVGYIAAKREFSIAKEQIPSYGSIPGNTAFGTVIDVYSPFSETPDAAIAALQGRRS